MAKKTLPTVSARIKALSKHLGCGKDEISVSQYDETTLEFGREEYRVLTDSEADEAARDYIADSLWAFNASFLAYETDLDECIFTALQSKCEGANDAFRKLVDATCGLDSLVDAAISADGRGNFLAGYDSDENASGNFFIYRTN